MHYCFFAHIYISIKVTSLTTLQRLEWCGSRSGSEECDFSQYGEEVSMGIDLPPGNDVSSGNVTPIPTTGELDECIATPVDSRRSTPLKSLLKNKSLDKSEASDEEGDNSTLGDKKSVRFSTEMSPDQVEDFKISRVAPDPGATIDV